MIKDCVKYFKSNKGYDKIFLKMREKWLSYGKTAGIVVIDNPSSFEREAVKNFFGKSFDEKNIKFKMTDFEKTLRESRYKDVTLLELLEEYFNEKIVSKKEKNILKEKSREDFFEKIEKNLKETKNYTEEAEFLLKKIKEEKSGLYKFDSDNSFSEEMIYFGIKAVNFLKNKQKRIKIAMLGAEITSDPHYFDRGTSAGNLLIYMLSEINSIPYGKESEKILEIYYKSGIEVDSISSFTVCFNIKLFTKNGEHSAYNEFIKNSEDYVVTMSNLKNIVRAEGVSRKIFIIENQMVFSYLCEYFKNSSVSLVCTGGQLKTASLILIDMLCNSECEIYYSGDIDPEGIEIADKLLKRGNGKIIPWCFSLEDYKNSISNKIISDQSIKKLEKIENNFFKELILKIKEEKRAGYQELILNKMIENIKNNL